MTRIGVVIHRSLSGLLFSSQDRARLKREVSYMRRLIAEAQQA